MIILTGAQAQERIEKTKPHEFSVADPQIYDYIIPGGAVLINKHSAFCTYMKECGSEAIVLEGFPDEVAEYAGTSKMIRANELKEMADMAQYLQRAYRHEN